MDLVDRTDEALQFHRERLKVLRDALTAESIDLRDLGSDGESEVDNDEDVITSSDDESDGSGSGDDCDDDDDDDGVCSGLVLCVVGVDADECERLVVAGDDDDDDDDESGSGSDDDDSSGDSVLKQRLTLLLMCFPTFWCRLWLWVW